MDALKTQNEVAAKEMNDKLAKANKVVNRAKRRLADIRTEYEEANQNLSASITAYNIANKELEPYEVLNRICMLCL